MSKVLVAMWLFAAVAWAQESADLIGRWRSVETSKGGIGAMYDFLPGGGAQFSPGAIVPMQYRVEGDRLITLPADAPPFTISFSGEDRLHMSMNGAGEDLVRLGATRDAGSKLVGEWTGQRDMGGQIVAVHWMFNADSSALFMIRFMTLEGRYELHDGRLSAAFGGQNNLSGIVKLADGILSIDRGNGKVTRLKRY